MKKKFGVLLSLIVIFTLVGTVFAASGPPGSGWYTGITLQNLSTSGNATVNIVAYGSDNSTATVTKSISPSASISLLPTDFSGMGAGFQGGAIVSSDLDLRGIVNVTNRYLSSVGLGDPSNPHPAAAQYQGMNAPANTLVFPLIKQKHFNKSTVIYVQNAGPSAGTATATFLMRASDADPFVTYTYTTPTLQVGQTAVFGPADAKSATNTTPPDATLGSLTVTSTQTLAGIFFEYQSNVAVATILQSTRAFTPNEADSVLFAPTNKDNYFNRFTGLQVQNVGPGSVDVKVTYIVAGGTGCTVGATSNETKTIALNASATFASSVIPGTGCLASAKAEVVSGTGKIVGVVNESYTTAYVNTGKYQESTTSFAFPFSMATTKVSIPIYKEVSFNKGTGINIQNVDTGTASVVIILTRADGTQFKSMPFTIGEGAARAFSDLRNQPANFWNITDTYLKNNVSTTYTAMNLANLGCASINVCQGNGALSVTVVADKKIVVIANESTYPFTNPVIQQDKNNYEGFNIP